MEDKRLISEYLPLQAGDTGPAGGVIIKREDTREHVHYIEVSPVDSGAAAWQDAYTLCSEFTHNGIGGWRLPSSLELNIFAHTSRLLMRKNENTLQTTETVITWSGERNGETAIAVVTQENEDYYEPLYYYPMGGTSGGYYKSKNGPWRGDAKEFPITEALSVRPVRDIYTARKEEEEK